MIATWNHTKEELCALTYNVSRLGEEDQWSIVSAPILNLDAVYCVENSFSITPIAFGGSYIGQTKITDITQCKINVEFPD